VTLILSLIRPDYVLQMADRRITSMQTGEIINDDTIKSVMLSNQMVFSFTGMAAVLVPNTGFQQTDHWLMSQLSELPVTATTDDACDLIQDRATKICEDMKRVGISKQLAFVGVGFTTKTTKTPLSQPVCVIISNFHDKNGKPLPHITERFVCARFVCNDNQYGIWAVPDWLNMPEYKSLNGKLEHKISKTADPREYVKILKDSIREVSARLESSKPPIRAVGKSLLVSAIPKPGDDTSEVMLKGPNGMWIGGGFPVPYGETIETAIPRVMSQQQPMFYSYPEDSDNCEVYSPHFVNPGYGAISFRIRPGLHYPA